MLLRIKSVLYSLQSSGVVSAALFYLLEGVSRILGRLLQQGCRRTKNESMPALEGTDVSFDITLRQFQEKERSFEFEVVSALRFHWIWKVQKFGHKSEFSGGGLTADHI